MAGSGSSGSETLLHLLRHADAGDPEAWTGPDDVRPLSDKGRRQSERLGRFLASVGFRPDAVLTSPKDRAAETAGIVAEAIGSKVRVEPRLGEGVSLETIEAILADSGDPRRPVLVGHDPDFSEVLALLSGASGLSMKKGAFARVDAARPLAPGGGTLRWLVPPDLLRGAR